MTLLIVLNFNVIFNVLIKIAVIITLYFVVLCDFAVFYESVDVPGGGSLRTIARCCHFPVY